MAEGIKENPLNLPKLKISNRDKLLIQDSEGKWANSANPETPSYQIKDSTHPERLPHQHPPKSVNKN